MPRFSMMPMGARDARTIIAWRYPAPYSLYNLLPPEADASEAQREKLTGQCLTDLCDARSPHFAARVVGAALPDVNGLAADEPPGDDDTPAGFFSFGSSAEVGLEADTPRIRRTDGSVTIGLGLRPDLVGRGLGPHFVEAILAFARERYAPSLFRLYVVDWNERARRVYERVGFEPVGSVPASGQRGSHAFIEMTRLP